MSDAQTSSLSKSQMLLALVLAVIIGGASFFAGTKYAASTSGGSRTAMGGGQGGARGNFPGGGQGGAARGNFPGGQRGQNMTPGSVSKIENGMLTIKTMDGSSKLIVMSSSTKVMQMSEAPVDALKTDTSVVIMGTANADGSITAATVQIRPARPTDVPAEQKKP